MQVILKMMEIKTKRKIVKLLFLLILTGCSHRIKFKTPATRFISPESGGKAWATEASIYNVAATTATLNLSNEKTNNPLELSHNEDLQVGINASIGIIDKLDFITLFDGQGTTDLYGVKYQILGKNRKEAKKGDHSFALTAAYGNGYETSKEGEDLELVPMDEDTKLDLHKQAQDIGLIYGKRTSDKTLTYLGINYTTYQYSGPLTSQNNNLDGKNIYYGGKVLGANLGINHYVGDHLIFKFELNTQRVQWDHTDPMILSAVSFGIGLHNE